MRDLYFFKNKSFITLVLLLFVSIGLMFLNLTVKLVNFRSVFFFVSYPVEYVCKGVSTFFGDTFGGFTRVGKLEEELAEYKEKARQYREKFLMYSQVMDENAQLKQMLAIKTNIKYKSTISKIVYRDPTLIGDYYIIDKGSVHGIKNDMPVISYDTNDNIFLVGKTVEVNLTASKVRLLTAKNFYLGVAIKDSGYVGILSGQGAWNENSVVDYIPVEAHSYVGQLVVTSGESDIFPAGIPVGRVSVIKKSVMEEFFQKLYVQHIFEFSRLKEVFVLHWQPSVNIKEMIETEYE